MKILFISLGCHVLIYPAAFNMTTGPLHWSLLQRSRANDNQCYVACIAPARNTDSGYVAWAHTQLTSPWAEVLHDLDISEGMVVADIGKRLIALTIFARDEISSSFVTTVFCIVHILLGKVDLVSFIHSVNIPDAKFVRCKIKSLHNL